jgi:hypothetical protein
MDFRVTMEFAIKGDPPSQIRLEHLRERLRAAAPAAHATLELGLGRMLAALTFDAPDAQAAVERARDCAASVLAAGAVTVEVAPAEHA